ncbi:helix-turn-helix domain-containing protein [Dyadobacter luticola]|uniref:helix-turn-helix domain-containing protein n=1 Tax=Dyadobacter luticola TaxID=1979387 RepID=UPI0014864CF7|nr:helix-turn-helix domain-containing protein [Dyadobacter luticola]
MSSNIKIKRICEHCGKEFTAKTTVTRFCGDDCAKRNYKLRKKNIKQQRMEEKINESNKHTQLVRDKPKVQVLEKEFLTVKDAAVLLACSTKAIHLMIASGKLNAINLGVRKTRILKSEILNLFALPALAVKHLEKKSLAEEPLTRDNCYTVEEITSSLGVTRDSVYSMVKRKKIPKFQEGKEIYISKRHIDKAYRLVRGGRQ